MMRWLCSLFVAITLLHLAVAVPELRQLTESLLDPSTSDVCIQATQKGCDYANFKTFSKCYNQSQSQQVKNQRHLAYCVNCLDKKKKNELSGYNQKQIAVDDCLSENQRNEKMGIGNFTLPNVQIKLGADFNQKVAATIPTSLDYSNYNGKNLMTSVKDQGSCGSCWSFAATAVYEAALKNNGFSYDLSVEAALECTSDYAPDNRQADCGGGYFPDALTFYAKVGGLLSSKYPYLAASYTSSRGHPSTPFICNDTQRIFLGQGVVNLYSGLTNDQIKTMLLNSGPLMVGVYANYGFMSYSSGTYTGCPSYAAYLVNHAVLLYGWNSNGDWLIKNQWGTGWGNQGYMKLSSNYDCGLSFYVGYISIANIKNNPLVVMNPEVYKTNYRDPYNPSDPSNPSKPTILSQFYQKLTILLTFLMLAYA